MGFSKNVIFTYKVVLFCILKLQCFWFKFCEGSLMKRPPEDGGRQPDRLSWAGLPAAVGGAGSQDTHSLQWGFRGFGRISSVDGTLPWPSCFRGILLQGKGGGSEFGNDPFTHFLKARD